jgi:hypothetical protein
VCGTWWKVGIWHGQPVYVKKLPEDARFQVCMFYDDTVEKWILESSCIITFTSGWTSKILATMKIPVGQLVYNFVGVSFTVLWSDEFEVKVAPANVVRDLLVSQAAEAAEEAWLC